MRRRENSRIIRGGGRGGSSYVVIVGDISEPLFGRSLGGQSERCEFSIADGVVVALFEEVEF